MQLIDTHTHLYLPEFDSDRDEIVERAKKNGVEKLLMPNIDNSSFEPMMAAVKRYHGTCYPMIGLHPTSVRDDFRDQLARLEMSISDYNVIAIGEIGIDLYWNKTFLKEQVDAFRCQISLSLDANLPVAIHSREAFPDIFSVLDEFRGKRLKGVFHAFTGDIDDARKATGMGFKLGIGGIVTFRNSGLDRVVFETGPEHLVLETDSPYLAPVPYRGKRNESSYLCIINNKLAEIFNRDAEEIASITYRNSKELFNV